MEKTPQFYENARKLKEWAGKFREFEAQKWEQLPDLELYMDQIMGYLNRQLRPQAREDSDAAILTSSMINNYVKSGLIARPNQKRYCREQIAQLYMLCSMKQILAIPDAAALIRYLTAEEEGGLREVYDIFVSNQHDINEGIASVIEQADAVGSEYDLLKVAAGLVLNAAAERLAAERIISLFRTKYGEDVEEEDEKKNKEKDKEKKKKENEDA